MSAGRSTSSSDEDDVVAEELYDGKADPGKQIKMDLSELALQQHKPNCGEVIS